MSIIFAEERYVSTSKSLQYTVLQLLSINVSLLLTAGLCVCVSKYGRLRLHPKEEPDSSNCLSACREFGSVHVMLWADNLK